LESNTNKKTLLAKGRVDFYDPSGVEWN
jgi:hypothetical protein